MIFSAAVRDEIIPSNPALNVDKPAVPDSPCHRVEGLPQGIMLVGLARFELATP